MVSIIIPIVKNDPHIAEAVEHINRSTFKDYEIVIVDEGLERSAQRNIGMDRAKGKYWLILDSDMMITPDLLGECVFMMEQHPDCVALYIPERIVTPGWFGKQRDWERQFYNGSLVDVVRFVKAEGCPRFDEDLHGVEDSSWERQMIKDNPSAKFLTTFNHFDHHDKCGLIKYLKKKWYYAACLSEYKRKNPNDRLLTFRYRCWEVYTENSKWKRLLKRPDMAFKMFLLLFARGVIAKIQEFRNP